MGFWNKLFGRGGGGLSEDIEFAARYGDVEKVASLLKANPRLVNKRGDFETTPLHEAAKKGHADVVELLLANKADIKAVDMMGLTPLHGAATYGHITVATLLIDHGADIHAKAKGNTPLQLATAAGHSHMARILS